MGLQVCSLDSVRSQLTEQNRPNRIQDRTESNERTISPLTSCSGVRRNNDPTEISFGRWRGVAGGAPLCLAFGQTASEQSEKSSSRDGGGVLRLLRLRETAGAAAVLLVVHPGSPWPWQGRLAGGSSSPMSGNVDACSSSAPGVCAGHALCISSSPPAVGGSGCGGDGAVSVAVMALDEESVDESDLLFLCRRRDWDGFLALGETMSKSRPAHGDFLRTCMPLGRRGPCRGLPLAEGRTAWLYSHAFGFVIVVESRTSVNGPHSNHHTHHITSSTTEVFTSK